MICFPNAKINLGLKITEKRQDGFHNLESIFVPINWCDALEIIESEKDTFFLNGEKQNILDRSNLVFKALDLLRKNFNIPSITIYLEKQIPMGAGLGGGSSDASFTLKLLNDTFKLNISNKDLLIYASQLGSDCPFFIENKISYITGRGENIEILNSNALKEIKVVLINPQIHISTKEAFSNIIPHFNKNNLKEIISEPIAEWERLGLVNDFEANIFPLYPEIEQIKALLYQRGASYACMSGSGSTIIGLFENEYPTLDLKKNWISYKGVII
jgi:4-diphosphocytidyl-2-C-methyl-D-erythritol kinase